MGPVGSSLEAAAACTTHICAARFRWLFSDSPRLFDHCHTLHQAREGPRAPSGLQRSGRAVVSGLIDPQCPTSERGRARARRSASGARLAQQRVRLARRDGQPQGPVGQKEGREAGAGRGQEVCAARRARGGEAEAAAGGGGAGAARKGAPQAPRAHGRGACSAPARGTPAPAGGRRALYLRGGCAASDPRAAARSKRSVPACGSVPRAPPACC